jgi:hypothetical protein
MLIAINNHDPSQKPTLKIDATWLKTIYPFRNLAITVSRRNKKKRSESGSAILIFARYSML